MGILDKVLPWKRKDELGLNDNLGLGGLGQAPQGTGFGGFPGGPGDMTSGAPFDPGMGGGMQQYPGAAQQTFGMPQRPEMDAFRGNQQYAQQYTAGKDIEIISAKLDAIKAALEALNQRLGTIERYIQTEQDFKRRGGW